jgi:hypothetical protein
MRTRHWIEEATKMKKLIVLASAGFVSVMMAVSVQPATALEAYSPQEEQQFMDWCTGAKSAAESTCSCTVKQLALTVPATTLTQFLSSQGSFSISAAAVSTGAAVTQAMVSCSKS